MKLKNKKQIEFICPICKTKENSELEEIGEYRGMKLELQINVAKQEFELFLKGNSEYKISLGNDIYGNITRIDNALYNIKKIDTIIVDPPRVGLSNRVKNYILKINPKNIIYVSCDSVTLARDLKTLTESYNIKEIKLFDLFPNTYHVECVAILQRKD